LKPILLHPRISPNFLHCASKSHFALKSVSKRTTLIFRGALLPCIFLSWLHAVVCLRLNN
jgi:hypothetical protein